MAEATGSRCAARKGVHSRQAHADMPEGTYEREMSKEGFFGPAAFFHHRRPPTGWTSFEGPLRPRAFDLAALNEAHASPWDAPKVLSNAALELRFWKLAAPMPALARNADGDTLLFVHEGAGDLFCDFGHLAFEAGDYLYLPRGTMWRLAPASAAAFLMIEATGDPLHPARPRRARPARGLRSGDARHAGDRRRLPRPPGRGRRGSRRGEEARRRSRRVTYPYNPLDAVGWHGDSRAGAAERARHPAGVQPPLPHPAVGPHHLRLATASWSAPSRRARSRPIPAR